MSAADADRILTQLTAALDAGGIAPSTLLDVVGQWVDRMARLAKVIIDSRLGERRLELEAEQLQWVRVAVARAIVAAQLDAATRVVFLRAFATTCASATSPIKSQPDPKACRTSRMRPCRADTRRPRGP
jgi:hypothetical protein